MMATTFWEIPSHLMVWITRQMLQEVMAQTLLYPTL